MTASSFCELCEVVSHPSHPMYIATTPGKHVSTFSQASFHSMPNYHVVNSIMLGQAMPV